MCVRNFVQEHALAQAELLKRQEELERKAAELDRREREMQSLSQHGSIQRVGMKMPVLALSH